jgi:riboflavin kinase/FMN adenylyltransferase
MQSKPHVIALGFFDGVHIGHGALLSRCVQRAGELGAVPAAYTFDAHPASFITGSKTPLLSTPADRAGLMRRCYGIQDVIIGHYDERLMKTPWREFVTDLVRDHNAVHLVAGHDFHFGYKGEGNPQRLQALCAELGLGCDIVAKVEEDGVTVSSTYIRTLIAQGEMARAVQFLGHPHVLSGVVRHGKRLGTTLGFPTVNLTLPAGVIVPAHGVYAARLVLADGSSHPAVTNVGIRPTLDDGNAVTVESYLLHFDGDLYEQEVRVEFYTYLRPERKFDTLEELRAEVMKNACQAEEFFQTQPL